MSDDLVDTREMYLKAIYELEEEGIVPLRARLVERLDQSKPTVSETVGRLERDGFLVVDRDRVLRLTPEGRALATSVMRKHRLAERLLLDVIQMPWEHVHIEACRWEHVMSEELEQYISKMVSGVKDPFGNPILPEGATGPGSSCAEVAGLVSVEEFVARNSGGEILIARIGEVLQTDPDVLLNLREAGLLPGARARLEVHDAVVKAVSDSGSMELSEWVQKHLQVQRV